jgi:microcystin-dependent protein
MDPGAKLEVAGQVKITDGSQGAGKVLTSDDTGLASWQAPSGGALPVGSVYLSVVSTNPSSLLGYGTWVQIAKGRALVGQDPADADWDVAEETRGEKLHTLTQSEMPSHYHTVDPPYANTGTVSADHAHYVSGNTGDISANHTHGTTEWTWVNASGAGATDQLSSTNTNAVLHMPRTDGVSNGHTHWWGNWTGGINTNHYHGLDIGQFNSGSIGSGTAFNNIQPSFVIFVWKRTS